MKSVLTIAILVLVLALVGWVTFGTNSERSSINLETEQIRQDTSEALESTEQAIENGKREFSETFDDDNDTVDEPQQSAVEDADAETRVEIDVEREAATAE